MMKPLYTYRVTLDDGSSNLFNEYNKTDARASMHKYMWDFCHMKRSEYRIISIELIEPAS
jgi:hypothetical protein